MLPIPHDLNLESEQNLVQNPTFEARNFRTTLIYRILEVHILNRVQNDTRLVLHTNWGQCKKSVVKTRPKIVNFAE